MLFQTYRNASPTFRKQLKKYYMLAFLSEGSKLLAFIIFFVQIGRLKEFMICMLFMVPLRSTGGGLHLHHYLSCFFLSFIVFFCNVWMAEVYSPRWYICFPIFILCSFLSYNLVPIISDQRPPLTKEQKIYCKHNTLFLHIIYAICICIFYNRHISNLIFWTIVVNCLQLIIACLVKGGDKRCEKH